MDKKEMIRRTSSIALDENGNLKPILKQYEDYLAGRFKSHDLMVLKTDTKGFDYFDINKNLIMVMRQSVIEKVTREPTLKKHGHGDSINFNIVKNIIKHPEKIIYIIKNQYDKYSFIFDIKGNDGNYVLLSINQCKDSRRGFEVNDITSIYGKSNLDEYLRICKEYDFKIIKK